MYPFAALLVGAVIGWVGGLLTGLGLGLWASGHKAE